MERIFEKIGEFLHHLFLRIYFCKYVRRRLYKRMIDVKGQEYLNIGLCKRFLRCTDIYDIRTYIKEGYLTELKQACEEHVDFISFDEIYFFYNRTFDSRFNEIRNEVLERAIFLCND